VYCSHFADFSIQFWWIFSRPLNTYFTPPPPCTVLGGWAVVYTVGKLSSQSTYIPRVTQCLFPRPYWDLLPTPSPASECILPFRTVGEGGHPRLCVRGVGPNSDDWRECIALCLCCGWQTLAGTHFLRSQEIHKMLVDCKTYWLSTEIYKRRRQNWQINFSINHDKHTIAITYVKFTFLNEVYRQSSNCFPGLVCHCQKILEL
jgi:hypothetical protein